MKTAMQQMIDWVNKNHLDNHLLYELIAKGNELLEKEKEQICNAYADGIDHDYTDLDIEFGIAESDRQNHAEKYYNQTY